jgi:AcrR family transcriptional regulator
VTSPPARRRLDAETRRETILHAAVTAFSHAPYEQVSIASIAADAGASEALVHRYFDGKAGLFAEALSVALNGLLDAQAEAVRRLPAGHSPRDRVRAVLELYLDFVADAPPGWAAPLASRPDALADYAEKLGSLLGVQEDLTRHAYAVHGALGFADAACQEWANRGRPAAERGSLVDAALGALEGALGDWGSLRL